MRRSVGGFAAAAVAAGMLLVPASTASATPGVGLGFGFCPGPSPLVHHGAHWAHRRLASGASLATARGHSPKGPVKVSVLRIKLRNHNVRPVALHGGLTNGRRLSEFAHNKHLVAAVNGGYFNTTYGAPKVPFVVDRRAVVLWAQHRPAAGIGINHRAEAGHVWLHGVVRSEGSRARLAAVNPPWLPEGLTLYTPAWGSGHLPLPAGALTRTLRNGLVSSGVHHTMHVPSDGRLLVARGLVAKEYLRHSLGFGNPVRVSKRVRTDAHVPFAQAYGTGTQVVKQRGTIENDLYCNRHAMYAARTTIGWNNKGSNLMLVTVESPRGPDYEGAVENQMSALMVSLGATRAFALDGGGSTELLARLPTVHRVKIRSHVNGRDRRHKVRVRVRVRKTWDLHAIAHGYYERRIPVGIGIYSRRVHKGTRWHTVRPRHRR